jgi:hypothetical protein
MSQSNAAAIKRRVNIPQTASASAPPPNKNQPSGQPTPPVQGLTLPQVIAVMDKRLVNLETFMQTHSNKSSLPSQLEAVQQNQDLIENPAFINVIDEFNHRFELLATELDSMKDIIIKLQAFTMEVNKSLVEERIHIFSEFGNNNNQSTNPSVTENIAIDAPEIDAVLTEEPTDNVVVQPDV